RRLPGVWLRPERADGRRVPRVRPGVAAMIVDLIGAAVMSALVSVWMIIRMRAIPRETGVRWRLVRMIGVWALVYCGVMGFYLVVQYLHPSEGRREALIRALFLAFPLAPICFF